LHTVQQLHHHALKLHRSLYLHSLHLKEKDDLLIRFRTQNSYARTKLKDNVQRWKNEKQLYLTKLGESWIKMAEKLNREDLLEHMEQEWNSVEDAVRREMNSTSRNLPKSPATPGTPGGTNGRAAEFPSRFGNTTQSSAVGPSASFDNSQPEPTSNSGGIAPHSFSSRSNRGNSSRGPFGKYRQEDPPSPKNEPNLRGISSQKLQIVNIRRNGSPLESGTPDTPLGRSSLVQEDKDELVESLKAEGQVFQSDTHLVEFLKKYAAEGFLEPPLNALKDSEEFLLLQERARVDEMTMSDELLTQWLWIFENDPELQEKIRRQNRFAGIVASSELDLWNKKYGDGQDGGENGKDGNGKSGKNGRFRVGYGDEDDEEARRRRAGEGNGNDKRKDGPGGKWHQNNYDDMFDPDDPANPNHPDHLVYMKSLQDKAAELERLMAEFEKQKQLLKKRTQELNEFKSKPKYTSDIDERALMEKLYDYRRMIQDRDEEILRLREALRDREKRKLKRNGKLNVFDFIALDDLYEMKLSDITNSSRCVRHPDVMNARPHTALGGGRRQANLIQQPDAHIHSHEHHDDHQITDLEVSSIRPLEDDTNVNPWSGIKEDSTFVTSINYHTMSRRPHTALAGKIHPTTASMIKETGGTGQLSSTAPQTVRSTSPTRGRQRFNMSVSPPRAQTHLSFGDTALYKVKARPGTANPTSTNHRVPFASKVKRQRKKKSLNQPPQSVISTSLVQMSDMFEAPNTHVPVRRKRPQTASFAGGRKKKASRKIATRVMRSTTEDAVDPQTR